MYFNAEDYGVPSRRKRYFCGEFPEPVLPVERKKIPFMTILTALKKPMENLDLQITDPNYSILSMKSRQITDHHYIHEIAEYQWKTAVRLKQDKGYMGKMSFPEDLEKTARTVMATMTFSARESMILQMEGKSNQYRAPTIREVASLMSFPIDYLFYGVSKGIKYRQVGNAVPPKMAFSLAEGINSIEKINTSQTFIKTKRVNSDDFRNLNFTSIPLPSEKSKSPQSRFKYHIPYLIIESFRVELTNKKSDFRESNFNWSVEIHRSQGKRAKIYPQISITSPFYQKSKMN